MVIEIAFNHSIFQYRKLSIFRFHVKLPRSQIHKSICKLASVAHILMIEFDTYTHTNSTELKALYTHTLNMNTESEKATDNQSENFFLVHGRLIYSSHLLHRQNHDN